MVPVLTYVNWPSNKDKSISSFYNRCHELSIVDVCLVWGRYVAIPQVLHMNHLDMSRMKPVARSYTYVGYIWTADC